MREEKNLKTHRKERKKDLDKRPLVYDATFDGILDLIVGTDRKLNKKNIVFRH